MDFPYLEQLVGHTPLVRLKRITAGRNNVLLAKLEGNNPAGSVKDRPALSMFDEARAARRYCPGRHPDRGDLRQHGYRLGDGGRDEGLSHGSDHAGECVE